jgi:hypothetical protein
MKAWSGNRLTDVQQAHCRAMDGAGAGRALEDYCAQCEKCLPCGMAESTGFIWIGHNYLEVELAITNFRERINVANN